MSKPELLTTETADRLIKFPTWLQQKQLLAQERLSHASMPQRAFELWRYADVKRLSTLDKQLAEKASKASVVSSEKKSCTVVLTEQGHEIIGELPLGVEIRHISLLPEALFTDMPETQDRVLNLVNLAYLRNGLWIHIDSKQAVDLTIRYSQNVPHFMHMRHFIQLNKSSVLNLTEEFEENCRINLVTDVILGKKSHLKKTRQCQIGATAAVVSYTQSTLRKNTLMECMNHHSDGVFQHHIHDVSLCKRGAEFRSGSINRGRTDTNLSDVVIVDHEVGNCRCEVVHRSLADGKSQIFNNAKAIVRAGADGSEVSQDLKNILLSNDARISSKPELEVSADEVVAAHGSTIGALDEKSLFYLQSRGIASDDARQILMESFVEEAKIC
ncbi:SufD family Fe-S cluster assembly protein [Marinicella sp. W31]|uniref:SufD family Fe-S cluster assembly protein n=1 Tax=Marinicella sp. W31 TaxID=3023713 RepID=UPI003757170F